MSGFALAALALVIENFMGYPPALFKIIGHPVQWIGALISYIDDGLNDPDVPPEQNRRHGILALILLCAAVGIPAYILSKTLAQFSFGWIINAIIATAFIAQKSLRDHVTAVQHGLSTSLFMGRKEVAKIVGRDPETLDENGVAKAALESLAENTSDGITAPILWYSLLGLPGLFIYKAVNTADSMIGHKSEKYLQFGWAAARFDDLINLPASRLTGLLFTIAAWLSSKEKASKAYSAMLRDASKHQSPNAGWPEAAMAGALGVRFGGPRQYDGETVDLPYMGDGRDVEPKDIERGLELYDRALVLLLTLAVVLAVVL
jgi:adenosylcobinamide-phosphate synthase